MGLCWAGKPPAESANKEPAAGVGLRTASAADPSGTGNPGEAFVGMKCCWISGRWLKAGWWLGLIKALLSAWRHLCVWWCSLNPVGVCGSGAQPNWELGLSAAPWNCWTWHPLTPFRSLFWCDKLLWLEQRSPQPGWCFQNNFHNNTVWQTKEGILEHPLDYSCLFLNYLL